MVHEIKGFEIQILIQEIINFYSYGDSPTKYDK